MIDNIKARALERISGSDLQRLLSNFKDLSDTQIAGNLINCKRKLILRDLKLSPKSS